MEHRGWLIRDTAERLADPLRAGLVYLGRSRRCVDDAGRTVVAHGLRARRADRLAGNASRCGGRCRRWWRCSRVLFSAFLDGWEWAEGFTRQFGQCGWIGRAAIGIRGRPSTSTGASSEGITKARRHEARRRPGLIVGNARPHLASSRLDAPTSMRRCAVPIRPIAMPTSAQCAVVPAYTDHGSDRARQASETRIIGNSLIKSADFPDF